MALARLPYGCDLQNNPHFWLLGIREGKGRMNGVGINSVKGVVANQCGKIKSGWKISYLLRWEKESNWWWFKQQLWQQRLPACNWRALQGALPLHDLTPHVGQVLALGHGHWEIGIGKCRHTIGREVKDLLLEDLPNGLVDSFDIIGDAGNILGGTVVCCNYVLHFIVPQTEINELTQESWADDIKFSSKNTVGVDFSVNRCVNNQQLQNKDTWKRKPTWFMVQSNHLKPDI